MPNRNRYVAVVACSLAAISLTAACRSTATTAAAPVSADTWAVVDGRNITRQDVEKAYRRQQDASQTLSDEEALTAKLNLLNDLVTQDILIAKATQLKVDVASSDLDAAYADAKKNIPDEAFQQELTKRGLTPAELREGLRRELLTRKVVVQEVGSKVAVTDAEITAFFNANRPQFNVPEESYHIAQIVITPVREAQPVNRSGDDAATPQAAAAKAQMLMERLKAGAAFQELAADYSEDPQSAPRGGDLGLVPVSRLKTGPAGAARCGAEQGARIRQRRERRRRAHNRCRPRARGGGSTRSVDAGSARTDHPDASRAERTTHASGLSHRYPERCESRQLPGATHRRVAGQAAGSPAQRTEWQIAIQPTRRSRA